MAYPALEAVGNGRVIDVAALDRPAVFIRYGEATQHGAQPIEDAVRQKYTAAQVLVGHVIDLHTVPGLFRGVAEGILRSEYAKAIDALPPDETAHDYVIVLPDWDGALVVALGLGDVSKRLGVAVFAPDGMPAGTATDGDVGAETLRLLEDATGVERGAQSP